jgi:hypothetical protein
MELAEECLLEVRGSGRRQGSYVVEGKFVETWLLAACTKPFACRELAKGSLLEVRECK